MWFTWFWSRQCLYTIFKNSSFSRGLVTYMYLVKREGCSYPYICIGTRHFEQFLRNRFMNFLWKLIAMKFWFTDLKWCILFSRSLFSIFQTLLVCVEIHYAIHGKPKIVVNNPLLFQNAWQNYSLTEIRRSYAGILLFYKPWSIHHNSSFLFNDCTKIHDKWPCSTFFYNIVKYIIPNPIFSKLCCRKARRQLIFL